MTPTEPTPVVPTQDASGGITQSQKMALLVLAGLGIVAIGLSVIVSRRRSPESQDIYFDPNAANWEESLRHFASAVDLRFRGVFEQLDALNAATGLQTGTLVTTTIPNTTTPNPNGTTGNPIVPVANQTAPEPVDPAVSPPPGPASVSM